VFDSIRNYNLSRLLKTIPYSGKQLVDILQQVPAIIMPPKNKDEGPPLPRFGRVGNDLKMGIVGLPNVGKVSH
jgi:predicted GTPase